MTKVVINTCYGGFGLSTEAIKWLISKNSPLIKSMPIEEYTGGRQCAFSSEESITDVGDGFQKGWTSTLYKDRVAYTYQIDYSKQRAHPDLIEVVESLGVDSWGDYAALKIVEIPDDVSWYIHEYDGSEAVYEEHRSWS